MPAAPPVPEGLGVSARPCLGSLSSCVAGPQAEGNLPTPSPAGAPIQSVLRAKTTAQTQRGRFPG